MKKTSLLLAISFLVAHTTTAQKWSAGYRTGLEKKFAQFPEAFDKGNNNVLWTWNNQVFLNRKITNRLEAEISLSHNRTSFSDTSRYFDGPYFKAYEGKTHELTLGLTARYYIYNKSRWQAFAQLGASANKSWTSYEGVSYEYSNSSPQPYSGKTNTSFTLFNTVSAGVGANYNLSKRFYCNTQVNVIYRTNGGVYLTSMESGLSDFSCALYAGIGFRF